MSEVYDTRAAAKRAAKRDRAEKMGRVELAVSKAAKGLWTGLDMLIATPKGQVVWAAGTVAALATVFMFGGLIERS